VTVSFITVEDQNRVSKQPRRRALTKCSWLLTRVEGKRIVRAPDSVVKLGQQMEDVLVGLPRDKRVCAQVSAGHAWLRELQSIAARRTRVSSSRSCSVMGRVVSSTEPERKRRIRRTRNRWLEASSMACLPIDESLV